MQGITMKEALRSVALSRLQQFGEASEIDFGAIAGDPLITVRGAQRPRLFLEATEPGKPLGRLPGTTIAAAVKAAYPAAGATPSVSAVPADDLYALAEGMPDDVLAVDAGGKTIYVDSLLGRPVAVMDASRRAYAWVYYALHTLNFPGLISRPLLRVTLVLILLAGGFALSLTGVAIATKRLRRSLS